MSTIRHMILLFAALLASLTAGMAIGVFAWLFLATPAKATERVDVALVLAVDHSSSVDQMEWGLQLQGYAAAFRSNVVQQAIASGPIGRIAVTMFRWSGPNFQEVLVPWTMIENTADANAFADAIWSKANLSFLDSTCIAAALMYADEQLEKLPYSAERIVVDVSGDEAESCPNDHPAAGEVRDLLVYKGIQINGLPILSDPVQGKIYGVPYQGNSNQDTERFYRENVIGGPGAFMVVAAGFQSFGEAIQRKLMLEIASLEGGAL
jgi:hypothetical protein